MLEIGLARAVFIVWQWSHATTEYVPSRAGQMNFLGAAQAMDPPKKMRVERILKPPALSAFIPKHKSMSDGSVVHRAFLNGAVARGWEDVDLGGLRGRFFVEAVPFAADGQRRVMSLFHLDTNPDGSPAWPPSASAHRPRPWP